MAVVLGLPELIGGTGAADKRQFAIHQQQLAMIAIQVTHAPVPAQRVVKAQLHPGGQELGALCRRQAEAAKTVQQATHLHPAQGRQAQLVDQLRGAIAGRQQIQLQFHLTLGAGNGGKHAREELRAVEQQLEAVTAAPGKDHQRALKISTALTGTARLMAGKPARARRLSRPSARPKSAAFSTSGARVTT